MNDPHVVALFYRIEHGETISYSQTLPLERVESAFTVTVKDKQVRFDLTTPCATEKAARKCIEKYVSDWELHTQFERDPDAFSLKFVRAEWEPGPQPVRLSATFTGIVPSLPRNYPKPSMNAPFDPDTETLHRRYVGYRSGREPLASMAYFCLTVLEMNAGNRTKAAQKYQIGKRVLNKVGELSETKGGSEARKAKGLARELTAAEHHFLEQAVKKMIRRAAEKAHDPAKHLAKILLSDLPPI